MRAILSVVLLCLFSAVSGQAIAQDRNSGNLIENSSFETGMGRGWGVSSSWNCPPRNKWKSLLDKTKAFDGSCSLRIPIQRRDLTLKVSRNLFEIETKFYRLKPGRKYTLSLYMRADRDVPVQFGLRAHSAARPKGGDVNVLWQKVAVGADWRRYSVNVLLQKVAVGADWRRYSVSGELKAAPGDLYHVTVYHRAKDLTPGTVWVDAVQLEEGEITGYAPRNAVEAGVFCSVPGNIYFDDEPAKLSLMLYNSEGRKGTVEVNCETTNLFDKVVDKKVVKINLDEGKNISFPLTLYSKRRGIFRLLVKSAGDERPAELVYSVLPRPRHLNEIFEGGLLGTDTHFTQENLAILKRANFNWVITKFYGRWGRVEPEKGKFRWAYDENIKAATDAKMCILLQLLFGEAKWAQKNMPSGSRRGGRNAKWDPARKAAFLKDVSDFTFATVSHYSKLGVKYYELTNEPYFQFTPGQCGEVIKAMYQAAKKADPGCVCVVNTDYRIYTALAGADKKNRPSYLPQMVAEIGLDYMDVISGHFYNNNLGWFIPWGRMLRKHKKPGWNTETGITGTHFERMLPTLQSVTGGAGHWEKKHLPLVVQHTDTMQKNVLLTVAPGGMEKYFYYFSRFGNTSPSQPTRRAGRGKENVSYDGSLRPGGVAESIASHFIEGCKYHSTWTGNPDVEMYVLENGRETRGFLWSKSNKVLLLTAADMTKVEFFDMFGNRIAPAANAPAIRLNFLTTFFKSRMTPDEVKAFFEQAKVTDTGRKEKSTDVGDFEFH